MAVGIDFVGPSILVLVAERLGAFDLNISYAAHAMERVLKSIVHVCLKEMCKCDELALKF